LKSERIKFHGSINFDYNFTGASAGFLLLLGIIEREG